VATASVASEEEKGRCSDLHRGGFEMIISKRKLKMIEKIDLSV
jgi:hypothetical protein